MAITTNSTPSAYTPAYNPQWWVATSSQTGQPNFRYRLIITDVITAEFVTKDVDPDPSGRLVFDTGSFAEQYITTPNPNGDYGFTVNTGAIRQIRVNIGEVYGSTPTYYAGSNQTYIVWNGSIDFLEMQSYASGDYLYSTSNNIQLITNNHNPDYTWSPSSNPEYYSETEKTSDNESTYLYFLGANSLERIRVVGFSSDGTQLGSTLIGNPTSGSANYLNNYKYIDVGYNGLLSMPVGQVQSGTYPIPVATYDYWIVYDESSWLPTNPGPGQPYVYPLKRYNKICEPRYDIVTLHYLTPEGNFETQPFAKLSIRKQEGKKSYYSKLPYEVTGSAPTQAVTYDYGAIIQNTLSSTIQESITLNTDWITELEATMLKDLMSSPIVYMSFGDAVSWLSVKVITSSYEEKKKYNSSLISVSFDVQYTHLNVRQRT